VYQPEPELPNFTPAPSRPSYPAICSVQLSTAYVLPVQTHRMTASSSRESLNQSPDRGPREPLKAPVGTKSLNFKIYEAMHASIF